MSAISAAFQRTENFRIEQDIETAKLRMKCFNDAWVDTLAEAKTANSDEMRKALKNVADNLESFIHDFVMPEIGGAVEQLEEKVREV